MEEQMEGIAPESKESIKISKNTKGYNWDIRVIGNPIIDEQVLKHLEDLDKKLREMYGGTADGLG
jgi:hypothetical protein